MLKFGPPENVVVSTHQMYSSIYNFTSLKPVLVSGTNLTQFWYRNFGITVWVLAVGFLICNSRGVWRGSLARVL